MQAAGSYRTSLNTKLHSATSQKAEGVIFIGHDRLLSHAEESV